METTRESLPKTGSVINDITRPPKLDSPGIKPPGVGKRLSIASAPVDEEQILKWLALPEEND